MQPWVSKAAKTVKGTEMAQVRCLNERTGEKWLQEEPCPDRVERPVETKDSAALDWSLAVLPWLIGFSVVCFVVAGWIKRKMDRSLKDAMWQATIEAGKERRREASRDLK